jgi:hypothetical protein
VAVKLEEIGKMLGGWRKSLDNPEKKNRTLWARKEPLSETEHELIVIVPIIVRVRDIVIQPQAVVIAVHVEDVRIAIAIGSVRHAIRATVRPKGLDCILCVIVNQPA